jgi:hypothetical protein
MYLKKEKILPLVLDSDSGHTCAKTQEIRTLTQVRRFFKI